MIRIATTALLVLGVIALTSGFYTLTETEQAIITRFGEPVGDPTLEPGLHFKLPIVDQLIIFDKRWLPWDGMANEIPTRDKKFIFVDTYARWRIADPLVFYKSVEDERQAQSRLDDVIDGATRNAVASFNLIDIVRTSDRNFAISDEVQSFVEESEPQAISGGREEITRAILENAAAITPTFGIELVDVQVKRINYTEEVRGTVYERMISERQRIAERSRSEGQGRSAEIRGRKERDLNEIQSEAFRTAEETKGKADALATAIYARAYTKDPDFYQFLKTLETYRSSLGEDVTLLLSSDSEFLTFLNRSR